MKIKKLLAITGITFGLACQQSGDNAEHPAVMQADNNPPTLAAMLSGLWSMDSAGRISNTGFFLSGDGSCLNIGTPGEGTWSTVDSTSFFIHWYDRPDTIQVKINRLGSSDADFTLADSTKLYRKVPFGKSEQSQVISGLAGNIN
ncbi:MAG: hypothetical protein ACKO1U_10965, partial [Bacteroidota bacterium]